MTARGLVLDLFAGTAGATAAFRTHGWPVVAVDLVATHRPDIIADVRALPLRLGADVGRPVELLWASPPCTEFSEANARIERLPAGRRSLRPSLDLIFAAFAAVVAVRPRFWIIENVRGAIPFLGIPAQKIGPWCLWGYFPPIPVTLPIHDHRKMKSRTAAARAAVPYDLSDGLRRAVEAHRDVPSLLDLRPWRRHRHVAAIARRPPGAGELFA